MNPVLRVVIALAGLAAIGTGILTFTKGVNDLSGTSPLDPVRARTEAERALADLEAVAIPRAGLSLRCPRSWEKEPRDEGLLMFSVSTWKGVVNVNVVVETLSAEATTQEYAEASREALRQMFVAAKTQAEAEELAAADFGGRAGQRLRVTHRPKELDFDVEATQYFVAAGKTGYTITFTAPKAIAGEFHRLFAAMVASVTFA